MKLGGISRDVFVRLTMFLRRILRSGDSDGKCKRIESEKLLKSNLH